MEHQQYTWLNFGFKFLTARTSTDCWHKKMKLKSGNIPLMCDLMRGYDNNIKIVTLACVIPCVV